MRITAFVLLLALATVTRAQDIPSPVEDSAAPTDIIVTAPRIDRDVIGDIPPEIELDEADIASYGASSLTDLLTALAPQTGSGRGRGGSGPVVLINGRRVAGFAEIRDLPSEAIERVQVLPEEVALKYGFAADQRVVNFILKPGFKSLTFEIEQATLTQGGRGESEASANLTRIAKTGRTTINTVYLRSNALTEAERGIIPSSGADTAPLRTLLPQSEDIRLGATVNRALTQEVGVTLAGRYEQGERQSLLGLLRGTTSDPIRRDSDTRLASGALTLDGNLGRWQWTATGNIAQDRSVTRTDTALGAPRDLTRSTLRTGDAIYTLSGTLARLPAGPVSVTTRGGFDTRRLSTRRQRSLAAVQSSRLARDEANARINLDIPLASADRGVAAPLGKLSINANAGYRRLSDFGAITSFGYGLNWEPTEGMSILASSLNEQGAPTIQQLGDVALVTPGVSVYDFVRAQTVIINRISGGNPALVREERRDVKLGISYQPPSLKLLNVSANYFRNRSFNPAASFPVLTPEIERAFPGRFVRDAGGQLVSIDVRPINYAQTRNDQLRVGLNLSKQFGQPPASGRGASSGRPGGAPGGGAGAGPAGRQAGGPGGGFGSGFGRFGGGNQGGRWQTSLYYTMTFRDDLLIGTGVPRLDLLRGSAIGSNGGSARHTLEFEGGWFNKGLGVRLIGSYENGTRVDGDTPDSSLKFSSLLTLNARLFLNFDGRPAWVKSAPILKGTRIALRIDNLTNAIRNVRDGNGIVPLSYQDGYINPRGRVVEVSLRKRF